MTMDLRGAIEQRRLPTLAATLAATFALGVPSALAAPASISGGGNVNENAGKATLVFKCGTQETPLDALPATGQVDYATAAGTATKDVDYTHKSGSHVCGPAPADEVKIDVPILNDSADEVSETFTLRVSKTDAFVGQLATPLEATVTIVDDDVPALSITGASVKEGAAATITVKLSLAPAQNVTVDYATGALTGGNATDADYEAKSGTLTFAPGGSLEQTISVPTKNDSAVEQTEGFAVTFSNPSGMSLPENPQASVVIFDDDTASAPTLSINDVKVIEGNSGTINALFTVTLSRVSSQSVQVGWRTDVWTATLADFIGATGILTFAPGETSKTISVTVKGDRRQEKDELFALILSGPVNAVLKKGNGAATILDDDRPGPKVGLSIPLLGKRVITTTVTCPVTASRCVGTLVAKAGRLKVGSARFSLASGAFKNVKMKVTRRALAELKRKRRLRTKLTATARDAAGNVGVTTRTVTLRRR